MRPVASIGPTDLRYGYFYTFVVTSHDVAFGGRPGPPDLERCDAPVPGGELLRGFLSHDPTRETHGCSRDPEHVTRRDGDGFLFDIQSAGYCAPIIDEYEGGLLIRSDLADRLRGTNLRGLRFAPAKLGIDGQAQVRRIVARNTGERRPPRVEGLYSTGNDVMANFVVDPPTANRCPFCGHTPIVCPECGHWGNPCDGCEKNWALHAHPTPEQLRDERLIELRRPKSCVVDPRKWEGQDFCYPGIVTLRMVRYLQSIHASAFVAFPAAVNMHGIDEATRKRIEAAREPVDAGR